MIINIVSILREVGRQEHNLIPLIQDRFQHHVQGPGSTTGHDDIACVKADSGLFAELSRHRCSYLRITGITHIAMHTRQGASRKPPKRLTELRGRLHHRVSQRKVEDILLTIPRFKLSPIFEHPPYPRALEHASPHPLRDRHAAFPFCPG